MSAQQTQQKKAASTTAKKRTLNFKTEVSQLLDLMVHSLYSNRDVFLRELISNASDALDKLRFASLSDEAMLEGQAEYQIKVEIDKDNRQVIIADNGIGMDEEEVITNIGTIANSGTKQFLQKMGSSEKSDSNLIGQFGVGFYSAFMVADEVILETRKAGTATDQGVRWSSKGDGKFSLQTIEKVEKGTRIHLTLREDAEDYLNDWKLKNIITQYSEHLPFPVMMQKTVTETDDSESTTDSDSESKLDDTAETSSSKQTDQSVTKKESPPEFETVNSAEALWLKSANDLKDEDYQQFYKQVGHDYDDPLCWMHNRVEGSTEYTSLIFIPKRAPFDLFDRDQRRGLKLYVKRVFIMDDAENFLPQWLRFLRGVVDCPDLPLNVSREILQDNKLVRKIRSAIIKRVIDKIANLAENEPDKFKTFWQEFGKVIKEGVVEDYENKQKIAKLLRFATANDPEQNLSLTTYIENMKDGQQSIFYLCGESHTSATANPHLEVFKEKEVQVLILSDRIDEWLVTHLQEFDGKKLQAVNRLDKDFDELDKIASASSDDNKDDSAEAEELVKIEPLIKRLSESLGDAVQEVRQSKLLRSAPSCVVIDDSQMTHNMQKIMQAMGQEMQKIKPILEINPSHAIIRHIDQLSDEDKFTDWAHLLLEQALLSEGAVLDNPGEFVSRLNRLLVEVTE